MGGDNMSGMRYGYCDITEVQKCCDNCDEHLDILINEEDMLYCPKQNQLVAPSGVCKAYSGWFDLIHKG